jgi:DNA-directed RNA polymerase specialized sigma24 family protein
LVLREQITARLSGIEYSQLVLDAVDFAQEKHSGQFRAEGGPYIAHPSRVVIYLLDFGIKDAEELAMGALHDVAEDTKTSIEDIENKFGSRVREGVDLLSKQVGGIKKTDDEYSSGLLTGPESVKRVKVFDRVDNLYSWSKQEGLDHRRAYKIEETRRLIQPLAEFNSRLLAQLEQVIEAVNQSFGRRESIFDTYLPEIPFRLINFLRLAEQSGAYVSLPLGIRQALEMHYIKGLNMSQISEALGLSESGVRQRIKSAPDHLYELMTLNPQYHKPGIPYSTVLDAYVAFLGELSATKKRRKEAKPRHPHGEII